MGDFIKLVVAGGSTTHTNQPTTVVDQFQVRITGRAPGGVNKNEVFNTFPMTSFGSNTF